jgi:uncharacterized protein (DUF697 family)
MLTERDQLLLNKIRGWEKKLQVGKMTDLEHSRYDIWLERAFDKLSKSRQEKFYKMLDQWLFHLHALIQGSQSQNEARMRILRSIQAQYPYIQEMQDLRNLPVDQLIYIAEQEISKHKLYSFAQGGLTGTGGLLFMTADIPLMIAINLRIVQLLSLIYGYEVNSPYEMTISLKVFHAATLPKRLQGDEWNHLVEEMDPRNESYFWTGENDLFTDKTWLDLPLKQILKGMFILVFRRKLVQGIPIIGMGIGAGMNYGITRQVTDFAHHYYQLRYLKEKGDIDERN